MSPVLRVVKEGAIQAEIDAALAAALAEQRGAANGLAPLDAGSKVPVLYLPGGAGSNLDADKLDGLQAADFARSNDVRLSDARTPAIHKGTHEPGGTDAITGFTNASIAANAAIAKTKLAALAIVNADVDAAAAIAESKLGLASDTAAGTASRRTLGTGAQQAAPGNDSRFHTRNHNLFSIDHPDVDVADTPANGEVLTFDATLGKWVSAAAGGVLVATEARQGTVKGNAPASETTDLAVYFRSDPIHGGFRDGCVPHWQSATDIRVRPGAVWIPSLRRIVDVPAELTIVPALAANTLGYLYVYDNAGTPAVELSTVAPVNATDAGFTNPSGFPLRGACRVKGPAATPDFTRRHVGTVLATATANQIHGFRYEGNTMLYRAAPNAAPFVIMTGGGAATNFAVSFASVVPPTSRTALIDGLAGTGVFYLQTSEDAFEDTAVTGSVLVQGGSAALHYVDLNASRAALYEASAVSGATIRALGYMEAR